MFYVDLPGCNPLILGWTYLVFFLSRKVKQPDPLGAADTIAETLGEGFFVKTGQPPEA